MASDLTGLWKRSRPRAKSSFHALVKNLPLPLRRRVYFLLKQHRLLSLQNPRDFSEKINWRMVYDRRPIIGLTCDKLRAKEYAAARGVNVISTLWSGVDLSELKTLDLPELWVLKPNHRTGLVYLGSGRPDLDELAVITEGWLDEKLWSTVGEWAYSQAERCFIVEERLGDPGIDLPDYKFFVFSGRVGMIQVDTLRMTDHHRRLYAPDWQPYDIRSKFPIGPITNRPNNLDEMIAIAQKLGSDFDFIRVDLYNVDDQIWFGELTPYPDGGGIRFSPAFLDKALGDLWKLPVDVRGTP